MIQFLLYLALPFEKLVHVVVRHFFGKPGVDLFKFFQQIHSFLYGFLDNFAHSA